MVGDNRGSALNGGPDAASQGPSGATGAIKVMGAAYADARAVSTTHWDIGA